MSGTALRSAPARAPARFQDDRVWQYGAARRTWSNRRIAALAAHLDPTAHSVLEVGCGDGQVARAVGALLGRSALIVGLDRALPGLRRFRDAGQPLAGDIGALPFADRSFDVVIASEVLEHLPDLVLGEAARELARVARAEILVSVPDREDLARERMRCPRCDARFNAFGHIQSLDRAALDRLFPTFAPTGGCTAGPRRRYHPRLLALRHALGRWGFDPSAVCPECGNRDLPNLEHDPVRLLCDLVNVLFHPRARDGYWLIARYRRRPEGR